MKKITQFIGLIFFGLFFLFSSDVHAESIRDFKSTITVLPDSSLYVEEEIVYDFEKSIRHGIFRSIPLLNSKEESMQIEVVSVLDGDGGVYKFTQEFSGESLIIKVGDPDKMVSGIKEFHLAYRVSGGISYYQEFDEIYWNTTGNNWDVPIKKVEARIVLPTNVFPLKQDCYYGGIGSKTKCTISESGVFSVESGLSKEEGLTVAVSFPKGVVSVYKPKADSALVKFIKTFWPISVPVMVFIFMFIDWYRRGRDPKGRGVIIPQYDVLDNLTPLEVGCIMDGKVKNQNISAEIIYLATKGYLKISQTNKKILGLIAEKDYEFTLLKEEGLCDNDFDKQIITAIFDNKGKVGGVSKLSTLKDDFYKSIPLINKSVRNSLLKKKYYTNFSKFLDKKNILFWMVILSFSLFMGQFFNPRNGLVDIKKLSILFFSFVIAVIIWFVFYQLMSAKTMKGVEAREHLLGLKEYLQIAEKDRLIFHNAPDKKPEIFERLLPYAIVFGVEELWAEEFSEIYINSPGWYEGKASDFTAVNFVHEMSVFSTLATTSFSSYPGSSGSSGGGFSGGGGGGGGGGSW